MTKIGWVYLQVVVLSFLFGFEIETSQTSQVLLADGFVDSGASTNTFTVVVGCVCPPVCLHLDVPKDHVFDRRRETWNLRGEAKVNYSFNKNVSKSL